MRTALGGGSRLRRRRSLLAAAVLVLGGCASVDRPPRVERVWPEPPDLARIKFVEAFGTEHDFARAGVGRLTEMLAGTRAVSSSLAQPMGVATAPDGQRVYVSDYSLPGIFVLDLASGRMAPFGEARELRSPLGVAVDRQGLVYVVDSLPRRILVFAPAGKLVRTVVHPSLERPTGIAVDSQRRRIYVADSSGRSSANHGVRIFDLDGTYVGTFGERGTGPGQFQFPTYLALDPRGHVYVTDTLNARIQVFDPDGRYLRTLGGRGDAVGMFDKPKGVALDTFGNVYVVDSAWSNVQIFNQRGDVLLFFAARGRTPGLLFNPTGIAVDAKNRIYVADAFNGRVAVYQLINTTAEDSDPTRAPGAAGNRVSEARRAQEWTGDGVEPRARGQ